MQQRQNNEKTLENLSPEQWIEEIRTLCNLTTKDFLPFSKRCDSPYKMLHAIFQNHAPLRPQILDAMRAIMQELDDPNLWTPNGQEEFLSAFAYLDETLIPEGKSLIPDLVNLLESGIKTDKPDTGLRTKLLALLAGEFRYPGTISFWENQYLALGDEASFPAFRGLLNCDPDHAIARLPALFEKMSATQRRGLFIVLELALCQPTPSGLERALQESLSSFAPELRQKLKDQIFPAVDTFEKAMGQFYAKEEICIPGCPNYPMYLEEMRQAFPTEQDFRTWQTARKPCEETMPAPFPAPMP